MCVWLSNRCLHAHDKGNTGEYYQGIKVETKITEDRWVSCFWFNMSQIAIFVTANIRDQAEMDQLKLAFIF